MARDGIFPVNYERHHNRYWRRFTSFEFAAKLNFCPIVITEVLQVAAAFPIAFHSRNDAIEPVALLSMAPETVSPFVARDGRWLACYVPSVLRCFPFEVESKGAAHCRLLVNETSELVTCDPHDVPFFKGKDRLTPELQSVLGFFRVREAAARETAKVCKHIQELNLFSPLTRGTETERSTNLLVIDANRLVECLNGTGTNLISNEALRLIHAHQVSLSHCDWLSCAQNQRNSQSTTERAGLSNFVAAVGQDMTLSQNACQVTYALG